MMHNLGRGPRLLAETACCVYSLRNSRGSLAVAFLGGHCVFCLFRPHELVALKVRYNPGPLGNPCPARPDRFAALHRARRVRNHIFFACWLFCMLLAATTGGAPRFLIGLPASPGGDLY